MMMKTTMSPSLKASILLLTLFFPIFSLLLFALSSNTSWSLDLNLLNFGALNIYVPIMMDKTSLTFSCTVLVISTSVMFFSASYMSGEKNLEYFIILVLLFVLSMNLLIFIPNLMILLIGWDGLGLTSYLLVIYYNNSKSLSAGMLTALTNRIGDALLILSISWAMMSGHWNFSYSSYIVNLFIALTIVFAAMTKSAQMPFSAWLPAAMAAPTPVSALVHSSTLVTAGVYLIIRFFPTLSEFEMLKVTCFYMGSITCMMASMSAMLESDLKKIIALSTLSQLGIMMMALGLEMPLLSFYHLVTHALFKALLFICAGNIIHLESHNQDIRLMGNLSLLAPINIVMFNTANLSLCGMPFLAGFYSKDSIIESFFVTYMPLSSSLIMVLSVCLTSAYTMRLSLATLWMPSKNQNFIQSCSKLTYMAYIILLPGAIMGGATMNWLFQPMLVTPTLPSVLKSLALSLIVIFGTLMFLTFMMKWNKKITNFMTSMWFLSFLSSNYSNKISMNMSSIYMYNEMTWMEKISGKGMSVVFSFLSSNFQNVNKMSLSEMLTFMSFLILLVAMMGLVCT